MTENYAQFSKLRAFFWPVHKHELKKLIPMLLIFFLLSFDYNILRGLKDTLVITAEKSGAEVIPFIKVWVMFPLSVTLAYVYVRLSNRFSRENVFYIILSLFLSYFAIFAFVLYPNREFLHCHETADKLQALLPAGFKGFIAMYRYWIYTLFYALADIWSNIILALLFWGFANQVTKLNEAKRFYGLFGLGTNFSGIAAGQISIFIMMLPFNAKFGLGDDAWGQSMTMLICLIIFAGLITMLAFRWLHTSVLNHEMAQEAINSPPKEKKKLSMRENLRYVLNSSYVLSIALIIIAYNIVINLVEVLWKHEVRELYPAPKDYNIFMNEVTTIIGVMATLMALFVSGNLIRKFGWTFTALVTPVILLITSVGFFGFFYLKDNPQLILSLVGVSPLYLVVLFGTLQNCCSRAAKYTVFDATKEMAFIPLSNEEKIKGKAAVDGICNRLGKSGGAVIYHFLLLAFASIPASAPYVGLFLMVIIGLWIVCVRVLGQKFTSLTQPELRATTA
ncbi:MAG: NTP/NDP exchange transporter [Verrucomicrobia bacterium]|nr:NTP/NDP exchange transporter [Verrucomicrobiota bacterium]MBS0636859.1 NTP/NDP exchange transporter [Verrucomicrobiota bacterium]